MVIDGETVRFSNIYNGKTCTIEMTLNGLYTIARKLAGNVPKMKPKNKKNRAILENHASCLSYAMDMADDRDPIVRAYVIYLLVVTTYECNCKALEGFLSNTRTGQDIYNAIHGYELDNISIKNHRNQAAHEIIDIKNVGGVDYLDPFHDGKLLIRLDKPERFADRYWLACILPQIAMMVYSLENPWPGWVGSVRTSLNASEAKA